MPLSHSGSILVVATTVPVVALFCTVLRLYYRWSRQHLGLDDAWAAFSLLCAVFMVAGAWVRSDEPGMINSEVSDYVVLNPEVYSCRNRALPPVRARSSNWLLYGL